LYILGGRSAVSDVAKSSWAAASAAVDLTTTLDCPTKVTKTTVNGSTEIALTLSGQGGKDASGALGVDEEDFLISNAAMAPLFKVNGEVQTATRITSVYDANTFVRDLPKRTYYNYVVLAPITVGATVTFAGITEGVSYKSTTGTNFTANRTIAGSSCTVGTDTTAPSVTMRAVPGFGKDLAKITTSAAPHLIITASEGIDPGSSLPVKPTSSAVLAAKSVVVGGAKVGKVTLSALGSNSWMGTFSEPVTLTALSTVVTVSAAQFVDYNGNAATVAPSATAAADVTSPTMSVSQIGYTHNKDARYVVGSLSVTPSATFAPGAKGSGYTIKVTNQRGLISPSIAIDSSAKTIVVTADVGYHTVNDVATAALNAGLTQPAVGNWVVGAANGKAGTDLVTANVVAATCGLTCGESTVQLRLSGDEPYYVADAGITVNVGGAGAPVVTSVGNSGTDVTYAATNELPIGFSRNKTIQFTTTQIGSSVISFNGLTTGVNDARGNRSVASVTFTLS